MVGFAAIGLVPAYRFIYGTRPRLARCRCRVGTIGILIASWILAATYLGLVASRPQIECRTVRPAGRVDSDGRRLGVPAGQSFPRDRALQMWGMAHGLMLLLGTVAVSLGLCRGPDVSRAIVAAEAPRLACSRASSCRAWNGCKAINKQSLVYSSCFIALGLIAGIILNAVKARGRGPACPGATAS